MINEDVVIVFILFMIFGFILAYTAYYNYVWYNSTLEYMKNQTCLQKELNATLKEISISCSKL